MLEPGEGLPFVREMFGEDLDRNLVARPRVASTEHLALPARSEGRDDLVGAETGAGGERHESPSGPKVVSVREVYIPGVLRRRERGVWSVSPFPRRAERGRAGTRPGGGEGLRQPN